MINKTIDRWAYQTTEFSAMCWVTVESTETCKLTYRLHIDRIPQPGKGASVPTPWLTVDEYADWSDLASSCPSAVVDEGVYATSLIGRGELCEVDVMRMVKPELDEMSEAASDTRAPFEILLGANE